MVTELESGLTPAVPLTTVGSASNSGTSKGLRIPYGQPNLWFQPRRTLSPLATESPGTVQRKSFLSEASTDRHFSVNLP